MSVLCLAVVGELAVGACQNKARAQLAAGYRLGLMHLETDAMRGGELANKLMDQLRQTLSTRPDFALVDTHVTLTQLSLAEDCNTIEPSCLSRIADKMQLDGFIFGKLTHEAGELPLASFRRFDKPTETIQATAMVSFGKEPPTDARIHDEAQQLATKLLGSSAAASVAEARPAPTAEPAETVPAPSPNVPSRRLDLHEASEPSEGLSLRKLAGYVLLGGAVASAAMSVVSFVQVDRAANNQNFQDYRLAVGMSSANVKDVCEEASTGNRYNLTPSQFRDVKSSCKNGSTFEVLQYVFIGSALLTGGLATFLLVGGSDKRDKERASGLKHITLHPNIGRGGASLSARMRF